MEPIDGIDGSPPLRRLVWPSHHDADCSTAKETIMQPNEYAYATHLDIKFPPLTLVDVPTLVAQCKDAWYNQTLCKVNDSVVRLGVMQGEYHWHKHDNDDEFFFVLDGRFLIDLEDRTVELQPQQGFTVPKGVVHRTRAPVRSTILMIETAAIVPTGDG
jgi:mannose-6-phosphate isomerase-like protein (cupin superfamily)